VRSQSGRILQNTLTDGSTTRVSNYTFDAAGRLVAASIPDHELEYEFASTGGCGVNEYAGMNGNRTSATDVFQAGTPQVTEYCYDNADRLTSTAVTAAPGAVNPVAAGLASTDLAYDAHGNTTLLADQALTYDVQDRHTGTVLDDGTQISYRRDASGGLVERTVVDGVTTDTYRYSTGGVSSVLDDTGALLQYTLSLPGGVSVTVTPSGQVWAYGNLHGDTIITTDSSGVRDGDRVDFDPFGQPIDPATGLIGTTGADDAVADTLPGDADSGSWGRTRNCMNTRARSPPSRWEHANSRPLWAGSCRSTRSSVVSPTPTTTPQTPSIKSTSPECSSVGRL
jgi:YD repeat-containing protein